MIRSSAITLLAIALVAFSLHSQDLEELWESAGDNPSIRLYFESLEENPIDLNTTTPERLQDALFLDPLLIGAIIEYRDRHFPLSSLEEITAIPGVSSELVDALRPYVTIKASARPGQTHWMAASRFYRQYPHSRGYSDNMYGGDPWGSGGIIFCYRGNLSAGGVVQKDANKVGVKKVQDTR